jgi:hypothetical protein
MNDIYNLLDAYSPYPGTSPEYVDKMLHPIPDAPVVLREAFILARCKGKTVVNFGSDSGNLHGKISKVAKSVFGVDKQGDPDLRLDLDDEHYSLSHMPMADVYVVGEIIEHMISPGAFLKRLRWVMTHEGAEGCEAIITVPNALSDSLRHHAIKHQVENVNLDHVAWYTYHTLRTLLAKCGFELHEFYWNNGKPVFAEGLIGVVK